MSTFPSNHTLRILYSYSRSLNWEHVQSLLRLNRGNSKSETARLKIIETHFLGPKGCAVQPFVDIELAVLPHTIAWMCRHSVSGGVDEYFFEFLCNTRAWLAGVDAQVNRKAKKQKTQR